MTNLGKIILNIIKNKTPCVFVSPHLDDAVFSAGGLILELSGKTDVFVFTIFTEATSERSTLSAKNFLRLCGYKKAKDLFSERRNEDKNILDTIGVKSAHLGFEDAAWRKKTKVGKSNRILGKIFPEFISIYPFFKTGVVSGVISSHDGGLKEKIKEKLISEIGEKISENFLIFCPAGIGGHVDHLIAREVCEELYSNLVFWSDYPYNIMKLNDVRKTEAVLKLASFDKFEINPDNEIKKKIILSYKTQSKPMFDNDPVIIPEIFYFPKTQNKE